MNKLRVAPYGAWASPISAASLVEGAVQISEVRADPVDADLIWWSETRPDEGGRTAVMRYSVASASASEHTPTTANIRTLVHEYGGGAWWPHNGRLFCVDFADQRLRVIDETGGVRYLTDEPNEAGAARFADGRVTPDGLWCVAVREVHGQSGEPRNEIVAVATDGSGHINVLYDDADFVMSPRLSADGTVLAWISWNHPNMGWDSTRLHIARIADGVLNGDILTIGEDDTASYCEPDFSGDELRVCCDHQGWWNLYDVNASSGDLLRVVGGTFDIATPPWVFGMQRWAARPNIAGGTQIMAVAGMPTGDELIVDGSTIATSDTAIASLSVGAAGFVAVGAGFDHPSEVVRYEVDETGLRREVIRSSKPVPFEDGYLLQPEWITFPTATTTASAEQGTAEQGGAEQGGVEQGGAVAHGLFYPPTNPYYVGPNGERPPLMVLVHGGPTAQARRELQTAILYWTSRGIAVVDVDYRGSTGYGREYRQSLNGQWGVADVADCVAAAAYLAKRGDVDPQRLMIRGGSAGGFTVLAALAFHEVFSAGASRYGIADLEALVADTHKFESRYLDTLIGAYPEQQATYVERSPINHIGTIDVPLIVLQGGEDVIVPASQAEMIVAALKSKGIEVRYLLFPDEQHGFRQAANIVRALEAELAFFGDVLGFDPVGLTLDAFS